MSDTFMAAIVAAAISGIAAFATQRTAARAAVRSSETTSRTDIEKEAFERAKGFYTDTIDRQAGQITGLEDDLADEKAERKAEATELRNQLASATAQIRGLKRDLRVAESTIERLSEER